MVPQFEHSDLPEITLNLLAFAQMGHIIAMRTAADVITKLYEMGYLVPHPKIKVMVCECTVRVLTQLAERINKSTGYCRQRCSLAVGE